MHPPQSLHGNQRRMRVIKRCVLREPSVSCGGHTQTHPQSRLCPYKKEGYKERRGREGKVQNVCRGRRVCVQSTPNSPSKPSLSISPRLCTAIPSLARDTLPSNTILSLERLPFTGRGGGGTEGVSKYYHLRDYPSQGEGEGETGRKRDQT